MKYQRPTYKELERKIRQAKEAVSRGRISILNPVIVAADALGLGISFEEIQGILFTLLGETEPTDYVGQHPPQRSYEKEILRFELLAFRWNSKRLGCKIYLKFAFQEDQFWLVSLHEARKD